MIFAVRTTVGQERNVSNLIAGRAEANKIPIKAILVPEALKGYILRAIQRNEGEDNRHRQS